MILHLHADGSVTLDDAADFRRFHVRLDHAREALDAARGAFVGTGEIESPETAWIHRSALLALGVATAGEAWRAPAEAMVAGAQRHGWVRAHEPSIKCHIVWRD